MAQVSVPPYSGAVHVMPVAGSNTVSLSAAAAGSSSAPVAQRPVAGQDHDQRNREGPCNAYDNIHGFLHKSGFLE